MIQVNKKEYFYDRLSVIFFITGILTLFLPPLVKRLFFDDVRNYGLISGISYIAVVLIIISLICIVISILKYGIKWWRTSLISFEVIIIFGWVIGIILTTGMSSG